MPDEILAKRYLGNSRTLLQSEAELAEDFPPGPPKPDVHVVHNFQHDLESLWWSVVWTLTHRSGHTPAREYADRIFQNQMTLSHERARAFESGIAIHLTNCLAPDLQGFVFTIEKLRQVLWNQYIERAENDLLFNANSYVFVHTQFQTRFERLLSQQAEWRSYSLRVHNPETAGKTENQDSNVCRGKEATLRGVL